MGKQSPILTRCATLLDFPISILFYLFMQKDKKNKKQSYNQMQEKPLNKKTDAGFPVTFEKEHIAYVRAILFLPGCTIR